METEEKFLINGGQKLFGALEVPCAKNACLPILAASLLTEGEVVLKDVPAYADCEVMKKLLRTMHCEVSEQAGALVIQSKNAEAYAIDEKLSREVRSSVFFLGSVLARFKKAKICYPGGCDIGSRPIDLHIKGLRALNIKIIERHGFVYCNAENARAGEVSLDFPSVGATENIMMASVFLRGTTTIINAAKEPEIQDLARFINAMGGKVRGAGTGVIHIDGVKKLHGTLFKPITDRIIAGTYLIATAMTGGRIVLRGVNKIHLQALMAKLAQTCLQISAKGDTITLEAWARPKSIDRIETMPYPGFPTDLQAQILALQTISEGVSFIKENLFETRLKHVRELCKMGADITTSAGSAFVQGVPVLYGAEVEAHDLRGGASLILAGLVAQGYTTVKNIKQVDRGYYKIEEELRKLGADIKRM